MIKNISVQSDAWNHVPFKPYVYRGTGHDQMPGVQAYGDYDYGTCKKCQRSYKSKHHLEECRPQK